MNEFDIQMAILGPKIQEQINHFDTHDIHLLPSDERFFEQGPITEENKVWYQKLQAAVRGEGYTFAVSPREADSYLKGRTTMAGYTVVDPRVKQKAVILADDIPDNGKLRTLLHEFGHVVMNQLRLSRYSNILEVILPAEHRAMAYNEVVAEVASYFIAKSIGLNDPELRTASYLGIHRITPAMVQRFQADILRVVDYMREKLGLGEESLPVAA